MAYPHRGPSLLNTCPFTWFCEDSERCGYKERSVYIRRDRSRSKTR